MLRIRMDVEDWRENVLPAVEDGEDADEVAEDIRSQVLRSMSDSGIDYERAYTQSVGAHVILQSADTADEEEAFGIALDRAIRTRGGLG